MESYGRWTSGMRVRGVDHGESTPTVAAVALLRQEGFVRTAFTAFFTFALMLSLLVFVFEGIRDAFDPRKTFR